MIVDIEQNNDSLINTLQCQKYEEDVADNLFSASIQTNLTLLT